MSINVTVWIDDRREVRILRANQSLDMVSGRSALLPFGQEIEKNGIKRAGGRKIARKGEMGHQGGRVVPQAATQAVRGDGMWRSRCRQTGVQIS